MVGSLGQVRATIQESKMWPERMSQPSLVLRTIGQN
jgi:hypothetical protein